MENSPSIKEINRLALPAIVAGISEPLISLADTAIIGQIGTLPLAAVGIASSFFLLIVWTLSQTKSAISALVSKAYGQKRMHSIAYFIPQGIAANFLLGILFFTVTAVFSTEIFKFYQAKGELLTLTNDYFLIRSIGFPLTLSTYAIFGIFRGIQNTKWAMQISLIGGLINLIFDLLLVFGIEGILPAYGVKGAAASSLIAQLLMFFMSLYYLRNKTGIRIIISNKVHPFVREFLRMSANLFVRTIALNLAYFLGVRFATKFGEPFAAAHTIAINIWLFSAFLIDGYSNAGNAMSGKLIGEGDFPSLWKLSNKLLKINLLISLLLSLVYLATYPIMASLFTIDKQVITLFNGIFWLVILCQPINSVAFTYDGIFKGLGETALLRNTLIVATLFVFIPLLVILDYLQLQLTAVWLALTCWMLFRGGILFVNFRRKFSIYA